ncbi:MAG TPA: type II toxin-antitoxin system VapC family toxin [Candidatus Binatia bacterium]
MAEQTSPASLQNVIFDTDVLIWYLRGNEKACRFIEDVTHERRALSSLTFMELLQGCRNPHEAREVKAFVAENISLVVHPDEVISRRAIALLEHHAFSHELRVVDAMIAATALETASSLATANVKHYRVIAPLNLVQFKP